GNKITIEHPMNNTNLIHVNDVISAINFVINLEKNRCPKVINVGGENTTMGQYVESVQKLVDCKGEVVLGNSQEVQNYSMISTNLLQTLGWTPNYNIEDIIKELNNN